MPEFDIRQLALAVAVGRGEFFTSLQIILCDKLFLGSSQLKIYRRHKATTLNKGHEVYFSY